MTTLVAKLFVTVVARCLIEYRYEGILLVLAQATQLLQNIYLGINEY